MPDTIIANEVEVEEGKGLLSSKEERRKRKKRKKKEKEKKEAKSARKKEKKRKKKDGKEENNNNDDNEKLLPASRAAVVIEDEDLVIAAAEEKKDDDGVGLNPSCNSTSPMREEEEEEEIVEKDKKRKNKKKNKKKERKEKKRKKKEKRKRNGDDEVEEEEEKPRKKRAKQQQTELPPHEKKSEKTLDDDGGTTGTTAAAAADDDVINTDPRIVESSALDFGGQQQQQQQANGGGEGGITLLLFYQYVEPIWSLDRYQQVLKDMNELGQSFQLTGRMRVAREGLNCTLTSTNRDRMIGFCNALRNYGENGEFLTTEFKLTNNLPQAQRFPHLKVIEVIELVHYGLEGSKAPPIQNYQGVHLEPAQYHEKIAQKDTVMIDVRNHYEAIIGHFQPPTQGANWLDPMMRKSTEFPVWLDKPETKEQLKGKQVLMYCTGGIRCERATALLKYKMENDPEIKNLGIQEVYQLQGGIDKYFKKFPDGGFWKGKNYVFDKRFAHKPAAVEGQEKRGEAKPEPMSKCEACQKPWDRFRGKRRCPTCGVPSLICKECLEQKGKSGLKSVRCDLCVAENITSKHKLRTKEQTEIEEYEQKLVDRGLIPQPEAKGERLKVTPSGSLKEDPREQNTMKKHSNNNNNNNKQHDSANNLGGKLPPSNPNGVTRLYLKNMCRNTMDERTLMEFLPGITHIVWRIDGKSGQFLGQGWIEMASPDDAAKAVAKNGQRVLNRPLYINFQPADAKDLWPPPKSRVY